MRLIDAEELKKDLICFYPEGVPSGLDSETMFKQILHDIDNAPTVEPTFGLFRTMLCETCQAYATNRAIAKLADEYTKPQGEYVDISKLRLMTVEECAGHTIDYAMGWKACVEWIKKGGAE